MKNHRRGCRCVGCSPATRKRGMRALRSRKRKNPRRSTKIERQRGHTPQERIRRLREIQSGGFYSQTVDGIHLDGVTVNAILTVHDALSVPNRIKYASMRVDKMADLAWKLLAKKNPEKLPSRSKHFLETRGSVPARQKSWPVYEIPDDAGERYIPPPSENGYHENPESLDKYTKPCSGCGEPVFKWADPCMACVRSRHRAAVERRCVCPKNKRREREVKAGGRRWVACDRCLGPVRQLS